MITYLFTNALGKIFRPLGLYILVACAFTSRAGIPPAEKLLPDDTLIIVGTPDFAALRNFYNTSPQTQLWDDPAMKPFRDKFIGKLREDFIQPMERELGVRFDDFTSLPQGQMTFAITQNGWQGSGEPLPAAILLLDTKEKSTQLKTNLTNLHKKWVDAGKTVKTEKIRDLEFATYFISDQDMPKTLKNVLSPGSDDSSGESSTNAAPKTQLLVGQYESLLIVGTSEKAIETIVAHLTGGTAPALADVPVFDANRLAVFRDAPMYGWVNAKAFLDLFYRKPASSDNDTPNPLAMFSPDKIIAATGLGSLKTFAFAFQNSPDGSTAHFYISAPESARQGLLKLLPADGKESTPPAFVPADAVKFQRARIDGQKAWATLKKTMNELSPQIMNGVNFALETANTAAREKDPGFDIEKNLFGNLGDDMISYEKAPRSSAPADLGSPPSLFLLGSPRAIELAAAMKNLFVLMNQGGTPAEREFLGHKIYSVTIPAMAAAVSGKSTAPSLSYAAAGNYVAITTDTASLEEYLRSGDSQQKSLRETAGLTEAAQKVGGSSVGVFGFQNNVELSRTMVTVARNLASSNAPASAPLPGFEFPVAGSAFKDWMDFSLLPPFDQITKYFYFSVYGLSANADGLSFKMFAPTPPQLKK